jgi:hypothetical protein
VTKIDLRQLKIRDRIQDVKDRSEEINNKFYLSREKLVNECINLQKECGEIGHEQVVVNGFRQCKYCKFFEPWDKTIS